MVSKHYMGPFEIHDNDLFGKTQQWTLSLKAQQEALALALVGRQVYLLVNTTKGSVLTLAGHIPLAARSLNVDPVLPLFSGLVGTQQQSEAELGKPQGKKRSSTSDFC